MNTTPQTLAPAQSDQQQILHVAQGLYERFRDNHPGRRANTPEWGDLPLDNVGAQDEWLTTAASITQALNAGAGVDQAAKASYDTWAGGMPDGIGVPAWEAAGARRENWQGKVRATEYLMKQQQA